MKRILFGFAYLLVLAGMVLAGENHYASELVKIPGGSFQMGSQDGNRDERPAHSVIAKDFSMGRDEVTLGWYMRCMADSVCEAPSWWSIGYFEDVHGKLTPEERSNLPITGISWRQAQLFCRWLGSGYSLPTEAEWEYAAGAAKNWKYPWGDDGKKRFAGIRPRFLTPVASTPANPLGLYDFGKVWEWVNDCYESLASDDCRHRITKGGSWSELIWNLRVANKSYGLEDEGYKGLGFRVVYHAP